MEKIYILEGLDCPNCALKIEKALNKNKYIESASVNAATLLCNIQYKEFNEQIEHEIIHLIQDVEDVQVKPKHKKHHHHEEHCCCGHEHHHEHKHHEECKCGHEHHEHHHEEHCCCGHEHHHEHKHHEECKCGHEHHEHHHEEHCSCGHNHHHAHKHHEESKCGHEHHEHHHEEHCCCGHEHKHEHKHHEESKCGHEHHEHHHEEHCNCGHEHHEHRHHEPENKKLRKIKWGIEGLDCAHCAMKVEDAVNEVLGVHAATLNFTTKTLFIYLEDKVNEQEVLKNVRKAILDKEDVTIIEDKEVNDKKSDHKQTLLFVGVVLAIVGLLAKLDLVIILGYVCVGYRVIVKAIKNITRGEIFDENFLMLIATVGAVIVGEYLEAVAVMLFYQVGEYFQDKAVEKSRKSIADLMNIKAEIAHLKEHGKIKDVDPEIVKINNIIVIQPGERVPMDGIIIKGSSSVDTSALTGESIPKDVQVNDNILAGFMNLNGVLEVQVTHEFSESTVSRILDTVENASSKKAKTELKMTRFARVYTPIVVACALILAIVPNFFNTGIGWQEWMIRACTFLVISCPCALVLSIPLGYFAGIGSASKSGILIKGGNYLEILSQIDTIVFDKTGTLTTGTFTVSNIYSDQKEECLKIAAMAESYSSHPIANSIVKEYGQEIDQSKLENIEEIAGHGIKGNIDGKLVLVGNVKLMNDFNIQVDVKESFGTLVYVAYDHEYLGIIEVSDTLKKDIHSHLKQLKNMGIKKLIMLTGDREIVAKHVSKQLGIDEVAYELLPTDKVNALEKMMNKSLKIAYVGDGINDAPVLARSDVGIAMGGLGSEAAIEASDIVLMKDDISSLSRGILIARETQKIMNQNIVFILGVKGIILLLSTIGYANMWLGVFADVGVSLLAVLNSMRILSK